MSIETMLQQACDYARPWLAKGELPGFIPELTKVDPDKIAVSYTDLEGNTYSAGDAEEMYTLQSVSKVLAYAMAVEDAGWDEVNRRIGVEPCGDRFNSLYRLELMQAAPSNPFINSGAMASFSCIKGADMEEKYQRFRAFAARVLGSPELTYSPEVCHCEMTTGHRNRALASMLLDNGIYTGDPEEILELYYRGCALWVNTRQVSRMAAVLAGDGLDPATKERLIPAEVCRALRAMMAGCGLYDSTGRYNIEVGIPAKSGSSGVIMAAALGRAGLAAFSPKQDGKGNSVCGMKALAYLSREMNLRVL
ncbi:MAG: glutaminase A [Oscillospiraceae bacterium]|nr:glutaminase A [Oscillospiraceae bacterium]